MMDCIKNSFHGQIVLITGATGFMGKVLVEKLLRSTDVKHIYLLIRPKRLLSSQQRIDKILSSPMFSEVKKVRKDVRNRITIVNADLSVIGLGLNNEDLDIMISQVTVILHAAANVKFDEPLKKAYNINVRGTKELLLLAKKMKSLKAFVHVSTAYSQCHLTKIDENIYKCSMSNDTMENILNSMDESELEHITPELLGNWPNTYCFTKAMAESLVADYSGDLPLAIFRPGIVSAAYKEPLPGWVDNYYGANGIIAGAYSGAWHVSLVDGQASANLVPVDMADNAVIAVAAKLIQSGCKKDIAVYNYVSQDNPTTYNEMKQKMEKYVPDLISISMIWVYFLVLTKRKWLYQILSMVYHYLPALIMDMMIWLGTFKSPIKSFWQRYREVDKTTFVMQYFTTRNWDWKTSNIKQLWSELSDSDKQTFSFDLISLDWDDYYRRVLTGMRMYLLKDDLSTLPDALARYKKIQRAHRILKLILGIITIKLILSFTFINKYIYMIIGL